MDDLDSNIIPIESNTVAADSRRDQALDMLDELDLRHDSLLADLDALSRRVESVLGQFVKITPASSEESSEPSESN